MEQELFEVMSADVCAQLGCAAKDIHSIEPQKIGFTNSSYKFSVGDSSYIYRFPGEHTSEFLSRTAEAQAEELARGLGLDKTIISVNAETGSKLSRCIENYTYIDPYDVEGDQKVALDMLRTLHNAKAQCEWEMDFVVNTEMFIHVLGEQGFDFSPYEDLHGQMAELSAAIYAEGHERVLCHNDTWFWNYLKEPEGTIHLIDWEYAGMNWPAADVADFTISLNFTDEQYLELAAAYEGHELSAAEQRLYFGVLALCLWYWFVWALYTENSGVVVDDREMWFTKAKHYLGISRELYGL